MMKERGAKYFDIRHSSCNIHHLNNRTPILSLQRAAQLLEGGGLGVSEVTYRVGFNDPAYFSRCFKKQFGQSPLEYARSRV